MRFAGSGVRGSTAARLSGQAPQMSRFMGDSPRYDQLSDIHNEARSVNRQMNHEAEGFVASAGLDAMAKVKASKHNARAIIAGAEADAAAQKASGMSSMIGSIASGFGSMDFSGGGTSAAAASTYAANKPAFDAGHSAFGNFYRAQ